MGKDTTPHKKRTSLAFEQRELLASDWNQQVTRGAMPTLRGFAESHGIPFETWRREFNRGKTGETVPNPRKPGRLIYSEYDPGKAQDVVNANAENKGAPMRVTNKLAERFAYYVKELKLSPYDAVCRLKEEFPGTHIPCTSTWYKHIRHGDIPVHYGETPYHPDRKRRKGLRPHPAKVVPGRLQLSDRPKEANERSDPGHLEMDTVVSCLNGIGGLLVMIDRFTREYFIEYIDEISQNSVAKALNRMQRRGLLMNVKSITTDNGCEFLDPGRIKAIVGCDIYYTRAYAAYEKGSIENCNRLVRRWHPKGADFGLCTRKDIRQLEMIINSIHRLSLGGKTATQFAAEYKKAA